MQVADGGWQLVASVRILYCWVVLEDGVETNTRRPSSVFRLLLA
jgi:hypothetical protein